MWLSSWVAAAAMALLAGCSGSGTDRPICNEGNPCGDGDADGDVDADADADADGDGDLDCPVDADRDGFVDDRCVGGQDCRDEDAASHPGAIEVCNGIDDDCVGGVDEGMLEDGVDVVLESDGVVMMIALAAGATGFGLLTFESGDIFGGGGRALNFYELRPDGTVQSGPLVVSDAPEYRYEHTLSVASIETGWIMAWAEAAQPLGPSPGLDGVIQVATVAGAEITGPVTVGDTANRGDFTPVIAVSPEAGALVVWNHDEEELRYVLLDQELAVLDDGALGEVGVLGGRPSVAWTGAAFLVASEIGADRAALRIVHPDGTSGGGQEMGHNYWDAPVVAWDGTTAAYSQFDNAAQEFYRLDAGGALVDTGQVTIDAGGKAQRMVGWAGAFAMTAAVSVNPLDLLGELHFWNLSPRGVVSNAMNPDDSGSTAAGDPWVVPTEPAGSWAVAWIDDDHQVRMDFVGCAQ